MIAVCSQIHTKHINTLCGQYIQFLNLKPVGAELHIRIQSVPRSKHSVSVLKTSQLMLYKEIIAVCSEIHTKQINVMCGQKVQLLNIKPVGAELNIKIQFVPRSKHSVSVIKNQSVNVV